MTEESILLVGAGGHARACIDVIEQEGRFSIKGLVGTPSEVNSKVLDYLVIGTDSDLSSLFQKHKNALVCVGQIKSPELRIHLFSLLKKIGFDLPVIISPHAYVSQHATLGQGTIVMHGSIVNAGASIGENCIINSNALVEHDVMVADHCHISTAVAINSGVQVGAGTFIGSNSSVRQCISIGDESLIGMGQRVLSDCDKNSFIVEGDNNS